MVYEKGNKFIFKEGNTIGKATRFEEGHKVINGFKQGHKINLGRKRSEIDRINISKGHKGKHSSPDTEFKKGINNPNFNNYSSLLPYDKNFNRIFKRLIKERDGCCMLCKIGFEDLKSLKRKVSIHHIDYNKELSIPQNCISLCTACHGKTNHDRKLWINHFQSILSEMYGYQYQENKIIMELR